MRPSALGIKPVELPDNACVDCGVLSPPRIGWGGKQPLRCASCWKPYDLAVRAARYDRRRAARHGMTERQFADLLAAQNGVCAIAGCGASDDGCGRSLHIDHDHDCCPGEYSCGQCVRGLLCSRHNSGIGFFHNSAAELSAAVAYLGQTADRMTRT